jgi:hypothetical protein
MRARTRVSKDRRRQQPRGCVHSIVENTSPSEEGKALSIDLKSMAQDLEPTETECFLPRCPMQLQSEDRSKILLDLSRFSEYSFDRTRFEDCVKVLEYWEFFPSWAWRILDPPLCWVMELRRRRRTEPHPLRSPILLLLQAKVRGFALRHPPVWKPLWLEGRMIFTSG